MGTRRKMTGTGVFGEGLQKRRGFKLDPHLLKAIAHTLPAGATVTDWGSGTGPYVYGLRSLGFSAYGIDGSPPIPGVSLQADFAKPIKLPLTQAAICIETGEHIPPEFESVFVENISRNTSSTLIVSWALPGQRGRGHVNCKEPGDVVKLFEACTWQLNLKKTRRARRLAGGGWKTKLVVLTR